MVNTSTIAKKTHFLKKLSTILGNGFGCHKKTIYVRIRIIHSHIKLKTNNQNIIYKHENVKLLVLTYFVVNLS